MTFGTGVKVNGKDIHVSKSAKSFPAISGFAIFIPLKKGHTQEGSPEELLEEGIEIEQEYK